jgi:hypothetical protein
MNDQALQAWLEEGLEASLNACIAQQESIKARTGSPEREVIQEDQRRPLEEPGPSIMSSQSAGASSPATEREPGRPDRKGRTKEVPQRKNLTGDPQNFGALFKNKCRPTDRHPNYTGYAVVGGAEFRVSAWIKESEKGKFLSLAFRPKYAGARPAETPF